MMKRTRTTTKLKRLRTMRNKVFSQLDPKWSKLPYPNRKYTIGTSGCGCCSVTHVIIELPQYWEYTPKDVQPYMKQFAVAGHGTEWDGITKSLKHYGLIAKNPKSMSDLFKILNGLKKKKKKCLGILLFVDGTKGGVTWTSSGHYIAYTAYKYKNGKHYFYCKDSGGRKHTGWYCYETTMKGLVRNCWNAQIKDTTGRKLCTKAKSTFAEMKKLDFKYMMSGNSLSYVGALKKRTSNCATYVSYVLQRMKLLKAGQIFWCSKGKVKFKGKGAKEQLLKVATITHPHKSPKKCGLHKGDICGYSNPPHTQIFSKYDKNGNALFYSFARSDRWKKMPRKRGNYNTKKIDTIIRLK